VEERLAGRRGWRRRGVVETRRLTKVFKKAEEGAVNDVDLVTRDGEFLVFSALRARGSPRSSG
jgi:hypothetical protein